MPELAQLKYYPTPIIIICVSLIAGIAINRFVYQRLQKRDGASEPDKIYLVVARSLKGLPIAWCLAIGLYWAINFIPLTAELHSLLGHALFALILFSSTMAIARILVALMNLYVQKAAGNLPSTLTTIASCAIYFLGALIIMQSFGVSITPILTALGVGGMALALGLQDTLANLFAGLHLLIAKQLRIGDYVRLSSGEEGCVNDISLRHTTIRALSNNMIVIPNQKISTSIITNFHMPMEELSVSIPVGVSYDSDLDQVEQVTIEVAAAVMREMEPDLTHLEPVVRFHTFADSSVNFNVILYAGNFTRQFVLKHEFIKRLFKRYRQEGIDIPYPIRTVIKKPESERDAGRK